MGKRPQAGGLDEPGCLPGRLGEEEVSLAGGEVVRCGQRLGVLEGLPVHLALVRAGGHRDDGDLRGTRLCVEDHGPFGRGGKLGCARAGRQPRRVAGAAGDDPQGACRGSACAHGVRAAQKREEIDRGRIVAEEVCPAVGAERCQRVVGRRGAGQKGREPEGLVRQVRKETESLSIGHPPYSNAHRSTRAYPAPGRAEGAPGRRLGLIAMSFFDPYAGDILSGHKRNQPRTFPEVPARRGEVVEVFGMDFVGAILGVERTTNGEMLRLEDRRGRERVFAMIPGGFLYEGNRVTLIRDVAAQPRPSQHSNSGSRRVAQVSAKVAAPSRIWVEGIHDAAIVEKVWGHDLRVEGVAVEYLEGLDNLPQRLEEFRPGPGRRIGVLADHLVRGSKETRLAAGVGEHVLVTGHPFIDIWAAVKPASVGIRRWPEVPRGEDWKTGVCRRLGWSDPREGWSRVFAAVNTFRDLDSSLIGAVERLVDFVTNPQLAKTDA